VASVPIGRDLQFLPLEGDAVVAPDTPVVLFAEDVVEVGDDALAGSRFPSSSSAPLARSIPS
jgi:hypothetical protein